MKAPNPAEQSYIRKGKDSQSDNFSSPLLPLSLPSPIPPFLTVEDPDGRRSDTASYEAWTSNVPRPVVWGHRSPSPEQSGSRLIKGSRDQNTIGKAENGLRVDLNKRLDLLKHNYINEVCSQQNLIC